MGFRIKHASIAFKLGISTALLLAAASVNLATAQVALHVGMNGGEMERAFSQHVFPPFERANNVKVVVVPGTSAGILIQAKAYKHRPRMDLMFLDEVVMYRAVSMGLCEKLKYSPELDQLYPVARLNNDMAAMIDMGMTGLAYNTRLFKEKGWAPPTSWMDLADPKYKGRVVFQSISTSTFGLQAFLMLNRILGGTDGDVEPVFSVWQEMIDPNVLEYISTSVNISEMLRTDQAGLFPLTYAKASRLKLHGLPIEYVAPKEGAVVHAIAECVIANGSQSELAQKLARYLLTPEAQKLALKHSGSEPSNLNVSSTRETEAAVKDAAVIAWDDVNKSRAVWNVRWNKMVQR